MLHLNNRTKEKAEVFTICVGPSYTVIIEDEFVWDEKTNQYEPHKFMDDFEHTGNVRCSECSEDWTGL